jgi:halocyanin-like protein
MRRRRLLTLAGSTGLVGLAGCSGGGGGDAPEEPEPGNWFQFVPNYESFEDMTDRSEVEVMVGTGEEGVLFEPPAITVTPGTSVKWVWTGRGGLHNILEKDDNWQNAEGLVDEEGHTWSRTFDNPGTHKYKCRPHFSSGMAGAVFVDATEQ